MSAAEGLKWWLIRRWPWGYRLVSRLGEAASPSKQREIERHRRFFSRFVDAGDLCFDVGANHGARSEVLLRLGARVVAVEPQPHCIERLRARFGANERFELVPEAVGPRPGEAVLHVGRNDLVSTLSSDWLEHAQQVPELAEIGWQGEITVPVTTLDAIVAAHGVPDFCKIDVEGYELEVLAGLGQALPLLSLEYTHGRIEPTLECIARLGTLGDYRYNLSELESMELSFETWLTADEVGAALAERFGEMEFGYGDVYARWEGSPEKKARKAR